MLAAGLPNPLVMQLAAVLIPAEEDGFVMIDPETGTSSDGSSEMHVACTLRCKPATITA